MAPRAIYYHNSTLLAKILLAYDNWTSNDYQSSTNGWYNNLDMPIYLSNAMLMLQRKASSRRHGRTPGVPIVHRAYCPRTDTTIVPNHRMGAPRPSINEGLITGQRQLRAGVVPLRR